MGVQLILAAKPAPSGGKKGGHPALLSEVNRKVKQVSVEINVPEGWDQREKFANWGLPVSGPSYMYRLSPHPISPLKKSTRIALPLSEHNVIV